MENERKECIREKLNDDINRTSFKKERKKESEVAQSCLTLCDLPWTVADQAPLSMGFSRQGYWSGLPLLPLV